MVSQDYIASGLADALLDGHPDINGFAERMSIALGQEYDWIKPFSKKIFRKFGSDLDYKRRSELISFIRNDQHYDTARRGTVKLCIRRYFAPSPVMRSRTGILAGCDLPDIPTPRDLAVWLGITMTELEWYADTRDMIRSTDGPLCHYRYKWIEKRHGYRLIESPKPRLKAIQRRILHEILDLVPAHPVAHGFRCGHSCLTYARPHVRKNVVIRMDLRDFFISIPARRINALFRTLGYPDVTARYLTGLCTNSIPGRASLKMPRPASLGMEWSRLERKKLAIPHLPQGAPTFPALANLCALHFDYRIHGLAHRTGADYTRYADDIAFSGGEDIRRNADRLGALIAGIARNEGFQINFRKTRIMHKSDRQILTGIVINEKINVRRKEYDELKAILYNCIHSTPEMQNRQQHKDFRAHLLGRINYIHELNQSRGQKLMALFGHIKW